MRILIFAFCLACVVPGGCGSKKPQDTPEAVAQAFADAMAKGDMKAAADMWDYAAEARKNNPDWDEFPPGQRQQIIQRMKPQKAEELSAYREFFGPGMKAAPPTSSTSGADVRLEGGPQGAVTIQLIETDGRWGVVGIVRGE